MHQACRQFKTNATTALLILLLCAASTQTDIRLNLVVTGSFEPFCEEMAHYYKVYQSEEFRQKYEISCLSVEVVDQVTLFGQNNATAAAEFINKTAKAPFTRDDLDDTLIAFFRTTMYPEEMREFDDRAAFFPFVHSAVLIGYNHPQLNNDHLVLHLNGGQLLRMVTGGITNFAETSLFKNNPNLTQYKEQTSNIRVGFREDRFFATGILIKYLEATNASFKSSYPKSVDDCENGRTVANELGSNPGSKPSLWLSSKALTMSLVSWLSSVPYTIVALAQSDVVKYGLRAAMIQNPAGEYVLPSEETIQAAVTQAEKSSPGQSRNLEIAVVNQECANCYPLVGRLFVAILKRPFGTGQKHLPPCDSLAAAFHFVDWMLDEESSTASKILRSNGMFLPPKNWFDDYQSLKAQLRCGPRREKVINYISRIESRERMILLRANWKFWCGLIFGLVAAAVGVWRCFIIVKHQLDHMQKLNEDAFSIRARAIRVTPAADAPIDRFKGIIASRKVVDRHISDRAVQCVGTACWGDKEVFLRPCSLVLHQLRRATKMKMLEVILDLRHKNLVQFYGVTELPAGRCLVCGFCPFGDLRTLIVSKRHDFSLNTKFSICADICQGMLFLHNHGIVHGNLRSCAVLIEASWTAKITDYEYDLFHRLQGTFHPTVTQLKRNLSLYQQTSLYPWLYWTAPEILRQGIAGQECPPIKSADIFSFAIVCAEVFAMTPAYQAYQELPYKLKPAQIMNGILNANLRPREDRSNSKTPQSIFRLLEICWHEDASTRPTFAALCKLFCSVKSFRKSVGDKIMINAEKQAELYQRRCGESKKRLRWFEEEFHRFSRTLLPPAYWRFIYMTRSYIAVKRHAFGVVMYCNLVDYKALIQPGKAQLAMKCLTILHDGFQSLLESGRLYRMYRNGSMFMVLGNVPYGVKDDPINTIGQLAFDFLIWAWRARLPEDIMNGFKLQMGIHSGPIVSGIMKFSTNQFVPLGPVMRTAWSIARSSARDRILISEGFHQNLRQLAQVFIKYRIALNADRVCGYKKPTYWLVGMNVYRCQCLLDDIFGLDPDTQDAAGSAVRRETRHRKGALRNEDVRVVKALPFDYGAMAAGGINYVVDRTEDDQEQVMVVESTIMANLSTESAFDIFPTIVPLLRTCGPTKLTRTEPVNFNQEDIVANRRNDEKFEDELAAVSAITMALHDMHPTVQQQQHQTHMEHHSSGELLSRVIPRISIISADESLPKLPAGEDTRHNSVVSLSSMSARMYKARLHNKGHHQTPSTDSHNEPPDASAPLNTLPSHGYITQTPTGTHPIQSIASLNEPSSNTNLNYPQG